jgi:hypothetical protein
MLKKTITYTDYNDQKRTEDFWFHLTKTELIELDASNEGGLETTIRKIIKETDTKRIVELVKTLVLKSYGEKSADGKRFIKSEEATTAFTQTEAYSQLFVDLISDASQMTAFFKGIIPQDLREQADKMEKENPEALKITEGIVG